MKNIQLNFIIEIKKYIKKKSGINENQIMKI